MAVLVVVVVVAVTIALVLFSTTCRPFRTRIKALALFAVILLHRTSQTRRTAVAAVEGTTRIVIAVIAISITLVFFLTTFRLRRFGIRIKALALFAVILLHRTAHTLSATVAAIEIATRIVIAVIAVSIALVLLLAAFPRLFRCFGIRIKALAHFAVILLHRTAQALRATVTTIEITTRIVVVVVTVTIALVCCLTTYCRFRFLRRFRFRIRIKTLAHFTVILLYRTAQALRATVTTIIITTRIVVVVIAVAVTFVLFLTAFRLRRFDSGGSSCGSSGSSCGSGGGGRYFWFAESNHRLCRLLGLCTRGADMTAQFSIIVKDSTSTTRRRLTRIQAFRESTPCLLD